MFAAYLPTAFFWERRNPPILAKDRIGAPGHQTPIEYLDCGHVRKKNYLSAKKARPIDFTESFCRTASAEFSSGSFKQQNNNKNLTKNNYRCYLRFQEEQIH